MSKNYKNLNIWKKAMRFSLSIYKNTKLFPKAEQFAMINQLQRAAISIPANIAEGSGRSSDREFTRFLNISLGSLNEVETFLYLAKELKYFPENNFNILIKEADELGSSIGALKKYLKTND